MKKGKGIEMKKITLFFVCIMMTAFVFAAPGTIHLVFANANTNYVEDKAYYSFDVQAWIDGESDVLGDGMVYIEYPTEIFNDIVVYEQKVSVTKTGILAEIFQPLEMDLYNIVNVIDTRSDVFAITFGSVFNSSSGGSLKDYYTPVSNDMNNPSDLFHVVIEAASAGSGNVSFASGIPGMDQLYFNYEWETFSGGLDVSAAIAAVHVVFDTEPVDPDPDPEPDPEPQAEGYVILASLTADMKKSDVNINWATSSETDNAGFVIKRSVNGGEYSVIASYETNDALLGQGTTTKRTRYSYTDKNVASGAVYSYVLESVDIYGNANAFDPVSVGSTVAEEEKRTPPGRKKVMITENFALEASYPNPFNPQFVVPFSLSSAQHVDIRLYDMSGKLVSNIASDHYQAGHYSLNVNCDHLVSGVYLLITNVDGQRSTQKMLLVK